MTFSNRRRPHVLEQHCKHGHTAHRRNRTPATDGRSLHPRGVGHFRIIRSAAWWRGASGLSGRMKIGSYSCRIAQAPGSPPPSVDPSHRPGAPSILGNGRRPRPVRHGEASRSRRSAAVPSGRASAPVASAAHLTSCCRYLRHWRKLKGNRSDPDPAERPMTSAAPVFVNGLTQHRTRADRFQPADCWP